MPGDQQGDQTGDAAGRCRWGCYRSGCGLRSYLEAGQMNESDLIDRPVYYRVIQCPRLRCRSTECRVTRTKKPIRVSQMSSWSNTTPTGDAELAMYAAKSAGAGQCVLFEQSMVSEIQQRSKSRKSLRRKLAKADRSPFDVWTPTQIVWRVAVYSRSRSSLF